VSTATPEETCLAITLRNVGVAAHHATRERDRLSPIALPDWTDLTVDHREAWCATARHVLTHYTPKNPDPEAIVKVAGLEVWKSAGMLINREGCDELARIALEAAGVIPARKESAT
jgi:hypothetical protein